MAHKRAIGYGTDPCQVRELMSLNSVTAPEVPVLESGLPRRARRPDKALALDAHLGQESRHMRSRRRGLGKRFEGEEGEGHGFISQ